MNNSQRYRIVAMGEKSPKMLSEITNDLFGFGCEIENISSLRLGHSFVVVLMVETPMSGHRIEKFLQPLIQKYALRLHVDLCTRKKYKFVKSDAFIRIRGKYTPGVKAFVIKKLTDAGLDIHGLESDIYEKDGQDLFISNIKGEAKETIEMLSSVSDTLRQNGLDMTIARDWKLLA